MLKKFCSALLILLGIAVTVEAAERVNLRIIVQGDSEAQIALESKNPKIRIGKPAQAKGKVPGRLIGAIIPLNAGGSTEVEMTAKISGNGKLLISAAGYGEAANRKRSNIWVDCTALEVNGRKLIPMGKRKLVSFFRWRSLAAATPVIGEQTFTIKATFAKTPEARAAKLNEAAQKRAEKQKAKLAQKTEK